MVLEKDFQVHIIERLRELFPGCIILKSDPDYLQGFPDLVILYRRRWAALEIKNHKDAKHRPNQDYYIELCNRLSYASFIAPECEESVLDELQQALRSSRTRFSKRF